jgi:hypothetical protein
MDNVHPLLGGNTGFGMPGGNRIDIENGNVVVDATPLYLLGVVIVSVGILAGLKKAGFKFVIGVGG